MWFSTPAIAKLRLLWPLAFGLFLLSCASNDSPTVSFAIFGDPAERDAYTALVDAFSAQHPDIQIEFQHIPSQSEYRRRLANSFSAGNPPDVMLLNYRRFATFAENDGLVPLGERLAQSDKVAAEDFFPIAIDAFTYQNNLWCIPQNISSLVVYYNKNLFDAAGVDYPSNDWTWDDFLRAAQALTQDFDGDGQTDQFGVGLAPNLFRLAPFVWQNGGEVLHGEQLLLNETNAKEALNWFIDLQTVHNVVPSLAEETGIPSQTRFLSGTTAMMFNSRRGVPTYRTIQEFEWNVAPLPIGKEKAGILHSDGYCLSANADFPEEAWTFIEFANSPEGQRIVAPSGRTVPSLIEVANSDVFLDPSLPPENSRIFIDTVSILRRVPTMPEWARIEETVSREIERAFYGQADLEEVLASAEKRILPIFNK